MRHITLSVLVFAALTGCTGGDAGLGESCDGHGDCEDAFQCVGGICVDKCTRSPECGDGFACDDEGICRLSTGKSGDACRAETECGPGLTCVISGSAVDDEMRLRASCEAVATGRPAGSTCFVDEECRNGACDLGHCTDLCNRDRDCAPANSCMIVPHVKAQGALFGGCLPTSGNIVWPIPVIAPNAGILLPVPNKASYASIVFEVDDAQQRVGATRVTAPSGEILYTKCEPASGFGQCSQLEEDTQYYANKVRHQPEPGLSVLAMPSNPEITLETGVYYVSASSFRPNGTAGTAIPKVTGVVRIGNGGALDLHLYFLDLADHPCRGSFKNAPLNAAAASSEPFFQQDFLVKLSNIFTTASISIGSVTYHDILDKPDLDGLNITNAGALLALGKHEKGINIFFVRTLSPVGLQAFGPSPGPAGIAATRKSGIVIGVDTLCYRSWNTLARLTAHEIARYMGLHRNVEVDAQWRDPIFDSNDDANNLMFYSELGGEELSSGQREILTRSPVLR